MTISDLKNHLEAWKTTFQLDVDNEWHKAVSHFVSFIEGKQAEADAVSLLTSKGYTVTAPNAPAQVSQ